MRDTVHQPEKEDGGISNSHFHVMCPIRPLDENGRWGNKQRREYLLDEQGNRVRDEAGNYVFNAVPTTDWGSPDTLEHWRQAWADLCNAKFAEKELPCRIDNRSYERQGIEQLPTVHEGPAVRQMEERGIRTDKGNLNRWIKATNDMIRNLKKKIAGLLDWLKAIKEELDVPQSAGIGQLLGEYYQIRNAGAYSQKAQIGNLKQYSEEFAFLQDKGILTLDQLHAFVSDMSGTVHTTNEALRKKEKEIKNLKELIRLDEDYTRLKPVVDAIPQKGGFGKKREKYMAEHDSEISQFYAVKRKLDNADLPGKTLTPKAWQKELDRLTEEYAAEREKLNPIYADLKKLRNIQYKLDTYLHDKERQPQRKKQHEL